MEYLSRNHLRNDDEQDLGESLLALDQIIHKRGVRDKNPRSYAVLEEKASEFEKLHDLIDFKPQVAQDMESAFRTSQAAGAAKLARILRENVFDFYMKVANAKSRLAQSRATDGFSRFSTNDFRLQKLVASVENEYCFESLPGRNPNSWPLGLDDFLESLRKLPICALFLEPLKLQNQFKSQLKRKTLEFIKKAKTKGASRDKFLDHSTKVLGVHLMLAFMKGSFKGVLRVFDLAKMLALTPEEDSKLALFLVDLLKKPVAELLTHFDPSEVNFFPRLDAVEKIFQLQKVRIFLNYLPLKFGFLNLLVKFIF